MKQTEIKIFDEEISMFPEEAKKEMPATQITTVEVKIRQVRIDAEKRFSRLRKNLRKRSVSIL